MKNREAAYNTHIPDVCPFQERLFYRKSCKIIHLNPDTSITYFWIGYRECHAKSVHLTKSDIRNRYADSTPKLVTEQSKIKIPVVSVYNETLTI